MIRPALVHYAASDVHKCEPEQELADQRCDDNGDDFLVVITHPSKMAQGPYQGIDIAKNQSVCA
ncbi:MAG: hypothetical protein M3548_20435 [Actinomycetota bacterium]|nr:hypothetical protein [Actinomycetota bacterium]